MKEITPQPQNRIAGEVQSPKDGQFNDAWWRDVKEFLERLRKQISQIDQTVNGHTTTLKSIAPFSASDQQTLASLREKSLLTSSEIDELKASQKSVTELTNALRDKVNTLSTLSPSDVLALLNRNDNTHVLSNELYNKLKRIEELTAARIKELYESNPNTEVFTTEEKNKLSILESEKYLEVAFTTPLGTWTITHNFGFKPVVQVFDANGCLLLARIEHPNLNQTLVKHSSNQTGYVTLS